VAIFVFTPKYLKQLLKYGVLPRLTSLFIDDSLAVREVSAGAFRNLSLAVLSGGDDLNIATEEVLALLSVLIRECSRCYVAPGLKSKDQELWKAITVQALHVLWNLVELSDKTVRAVEREQLFPVILQFAQVLEDKDVSLPAAQCLLSLSEGNADLCSCVARSCQHVDHIVSCVKKAQKSSSGMVVGVALSGVLCNIATEMSSDKVLNLFNLVHGTLGDVLDVDITSLLAPPTKDTSSSSLVVDAKDSVSDKIRNILSSQMLALEILSNSIAQDEDDWEDMDEEGTGNESVLVTEGPGCDSILLDSVVKHGLAAKVTLLRYSVIKLSSLCANALGLEKEPFFPFRSVWYASPTPSTLSKVVGGPMHSHALSPKPSGCPGHTHLGRGSWITGNDSIFIFFLEQQQSK
jgi:hypothetical protein